MRYLTVGDVIAICEREVGGDQLVDFGLLESAVLRPQTTVGGQDAYSGIHEKAAALLHSLARNHPFVDGNKRTAAIAMITLYALNGYTFTMDQGDLVALVVDTAEGQIDVGGIAAVLKDHGAPVEL